MVTGGWDNLVIGAPRKPYGVGLDSPDPADVLVFIFNSTIHAALDVYVFKDSFNCISKAELTTARSAIRWLTSTLNKFF